MFRQLPSTGFHTNNLDKILPLICTPRYKVSIKTNHRRFFIHCSNYILFIASNTTNRKGIQHRLVSSKLDSDGHVLIALSFSDWITGQIWKCYPWTGNRILAKTVNVFSPLGGVCSHLSYLLTIEA